MCASATASFAPTLWSLWLIRVAQRQLLARADQRAVDIAQVGIADAVLHFADFFVGFGQFALQREIVARFAGQLIEIGLRALDQQKPRRRGAGQIANGVADFEQNAVGQRADVVETGPCPCLLPSS